ncbi:cupin domain-containing protein [Actinoallomurus rhizosphaericola]|uniref:cupin domain-containing protein n=1 Tax=Actinoallomurus rhizosphaericola TaxID=2952536 RepID=UPI0020930C9B|nr:cupin domain-containing protein [Actinoallomurus rhizosphaericola]MCO5997697.1 cupin domain-containing protein [Actinoallomurus rhizosphaericola]
MSIPYLAQAAEHEQLEWLGGGAMRILLDGAKTDGRLTMLRSETAGRTASPVHVHDREDEIVVLLKGSGIFWVGEDRYELSEGGVALLPRNIPHAYRFTSDSVDMLAICTPAGTEEFFRAAGWDLSRPKPDGWEITPAVLAAAAESTGQTILGPPLAADQMIPPTYLAGRA